MADATKASKWVINVKAPSVKREIAVEAPFAEDAAEIRKYVGDEKFERCAIDEVKTRLQTAVRNALESGMTDEKVKQFAKTWNLSSRIERVDPFEAVRTKIATMGSIEEQLAYIKDLEAKVKGGKK